MGLLELADVRSATSPAASSSALFLAQALAQDAELILLDEPFSGLDFPSQEALFSILDQLRSAGVTALIATHDLNLAAERFDQSCWSTAG